MMDMEGSEAPSTTKKGYSIAQFEARVKTLERRKSGSPSDSIFPFPKHQF